MHEEYVESYPQRIWNCPNCSHENMIDDDEFILGEAHGKECMKCRRVYVVTN